LTIWALRFFCSFKRRSPSAAARRSAAHTESPHEMFFRQRKALSPKLKSFGLADFYWARDKLQMLCGPGALQAHHFYGACDLNRPFFSCCSAHARRFGQRERPGHRGAAVVPLGALVAATPHPCPGANAHCSPGVLLLRKSNRADAERTQI
jgi:hypothetical protein